MTKVAGQTLESLHLAGQLSDIKRANIIVQPGFTPVLIDWGSAEAIRAPGDRRRSSGFTPAFVSPAQTRGLARPTNDSFTLGVPLDALVQ